MGLLKTHRWFRGILLLSLLWVTTPSSAAQVLGCLEQNLAELIQESANFDTLAARADILHLVRENNIPAFSKKITGGEISVILMDRTTAPKLEPFLAQSLGTQIQLQPNWKNDHGSLRVTNHLIDADTPGARSYGELHKTGIAWKPLDSYMVRRQTGHHVILEVAYRLTPYERSVAEYYQRVRRAAVFRVKFTFGSGRSAEDYVNQLDGGGEHCFLFCKGTQVQTQVREIESKLGQAGVADSNAILGSPEVQKYLGQVIPKLMAANPDQENSLNASLIQQPEDLAVIAPLKPERMDIRLFAEWLVALDASRKYSQLLISLRVTSSTGMSDMNNPRATAILIYDSDGKDQQFRDATYTSHGIFYNWTLDGQYPLAPR